MQAFVTDLVHDHYRNDDITNETCHKYRNPMDNDNWSSFYDSGRYGGSTIRLVPVSKPEAVMDLVEWGIPVIYGETAQEAAFNMSLENPPIIGKWVATELHFRDLEGHWVQREGIQLGMNTLTAEDVDRMVAYVTENPDFKFSVPESKLRKLPPESRAYFSYNQLKLEGYKSRLSYWKKSNVREVAAADINSAYRTTQGVVNNYRNLVLELKQTTLNLLKINRWLNGKNQISRAMRATCDPSELLEFDGYITKLTGKKLTYRLSKHWPLMISEITPDRLKALEKRHAEEFARWLVKEQRAFKRMEAKQVTKEEQQSG